MISDQQVRALAFLAADARPHGARRWDQAEIIAAVEKIRHLRLVDVGLALLRCADDRDANSPFAITNLKSPHWRERDTSWQAPIEPFDRAETCGTCGQRRHVCESKPHADPPFESAGLSARNGGRDISGVVVELRDHIAKAEPAEVVPIRRNRGADPPTDEYQTTRAAQPGGSTHSQTPGGPA
jgi:hypothetical protein